MNKLAATLCLVLAGALACLAAEDAAAPRAGPMSAQEMIDMHEGRGEHEAAKQVAEMKRRNKLADGVLDLGIIGAKGLGRIGRESRPTIEHIGKTIDQEAQSLGKKIQGNKHINGAWRSISENKHIRGGVEALKPFAKNVNEKYGKLGEKVKPLIEQGKAKAKPYLDEAERRRQILLAEHEARQAKLREQQKKLEQQQDVESEDDDEE